MAARNPTLVDPTSSARYPPETPLRFAFAKCRNVTATIRPLPIAVTDIAHAEVCLMRPNAGIKPHREAVSA